MRGGTGHKYWSEFSEDAQRRIESLGAELYKALYSPPLGDSPIKTLDVPVAGRGYNTLPFVFDLVNLANGVPLPENEANKKIDKALARDQDGSGTTSFLEAVKKAVGLMTGTSPSCLGLHPAIYFYGRSGTFQPISFLAAVEFISHLVRDKKLKEFIKVRAAFERFLFDNKAFISLTSNRLGSGARSLHRIVSLYERVMQGLLAGTDPEKIRDALFDDPDFSHLGVVKMPSPRAGLRHNPNRNFSTGTKSAAFFRDAIEGAPKCAICGAAVHRNSMSFDHALQKRKGGTAEMENAQIAHPYCNSIKN